MENELEHLTFETSSNNINPDSSVRRKLDQPKNPYLPDDRDQYSSTTEITKEQSEQDDAGKAGINIQLKDDLNETKIEESASSLLPPDLRSVSEEIDQYLTKLSNEYQPPDHVPICVQQFADLVEAKIANYDDSHAPIKWTEESATSFLEAVFRISKLYTSLCKFSSETEYAYYINRVGGVLQHAMSYIEEEFKSLLDDSKLINPGSDHFINAKPEQSPVPSTNNQDHTEQSSLLPGTPDMEEYKFPGYSEEIIKNLNGLSKAMMAGSYESECCQAYLIARRKILEESLYKLGFEKYSIDAVQKMPWDSLETEIVAWIRAFRQCTNVLFSRERELSHAVFGNQQHQSISETIFVTLSRGMLYQLLNFSEAVSMTKRAAEKLFKFLDIYETLRDRLLPLVDSITFPDDYANELKAKASLIRTSLGESMVCIFSELENSINADANKSTPVPGGAVHPLTRYIMNYLKYACEYIATLEQVFREHQKIDTANSHNADNQTNCNNNNTELSPFAKQIMKVMDLLDSHLESKSRLYKDPALSSIFMMNNGRYVLQKIKGSPEINGLMGDQWYRKRSTDLRQYHKTYQRETWGKLLHCLNQEGLNVNGKVNKPNLKERFKSFNAVFDEIYKAQSNWVISDEQLQSELRVSISNMVVPAYRSFLGRYSQTFYPGRQTEKYVKYQPEDIETSIDELFDGNAPSMGRNKKL
ncbi:exocyst complex component EXO70C1-like [Lycium barbarum]|uniref:exocyst complex component EXO70C1-like n=1 Tax=Lycium barbarum TaxID=112863 RepID=UPI00293E1D39|nr:exocyst complex component EXO70C1-like [Lycium barbarum]